MSQETRICENSLLKRSLRVQGACGGNKSRSGKDDKTRLDVAGMAGNPGNRWLSWSLFPGSYSLSLRTTAEHRLDRFDISDYV